MPYPVQTDQRTCYVVFEYICDYIDQRGYPPSMRNIADACQLGTTTVYYTLNKLEAWGWLEREPRVPRSLRILRARRDPAKKIEQN